jgi:hypothetical protein
VTRYANARVALAAVVRERPSSIQVGAAITLDSCRSRSGIRDSPPKRTRGTSETALQADMAESSQQPVLPLQSAMAC